MENNNKLEKVLKRDFDESSDFIEDQINLIKSYTEIIETTHHLDIVKEDPADNIIFECALYCNADFIVSGDNHLLKIKSYNNIKVLNPSDFLKILET